MGPPSYKRSVVGRQVVMRRVLVLPGGQQARLPESVRDTAPQ
jgi:hypothetical protein